MAATALIIGIDCYKNPAWNLTGALRDAIDFAAWTVACGGVAVDDVTLLVSPCDPAKLAALLAERDAPAALLGRCAEAKTETIRETLYKRETEPTNHDRLWFYYAGHGLAPPGTSPEAGPLMVPADVEDLGLYARSPIGIELFREAMQEKPPREQFYFVDACRDVLELPGNKALSQHLIWNDKKLPANTLAMQAVLFAATAGERAKEIRGKGVFGRVLMAGLHGRGPKLEPPRTGGGPRRHRLRFGALAEFVKLAVPKALEDEGARAEELQLPEPRTLRGELEIASFAHGNLPTVKLTPIVMPVRARKLGKIEFVYWNEDQQDFVAHAENPKPHGPPIMEPSEFVVTGGPKIIHVTSGGYHLEEVAILAYEDRRFPVELRESMQERLERLADERPGGIIARCEDPLARVTIFHRNGAVLDSQYREAKAEPLRPGRYRVRAELTAAEATEILVDVIPGRVDEHVVELAAAMPSPAPAVLDALDRVGMSYDKHRGLDVSSNLGLIASTRLSGLLAYAAWAMQWPPETGFHRLRELGLPKLVLDVRDSALRVLVGDANAEPGYLDRVQLETRVADRHDVTMVGLRAPGPLAMVRAATSRLPAGSYRVRLQLPGFGAQTFAVSLLTGFVTALVVTREQDGRIDIQQHYNPIDPTRPVRPGLPLPMRDDVRLVELAWRALERRDPPAPIEHNGLIDGKCANPLLAVIAGYRLLGTEREDQFRGPRERVDVDVLGRSALRSMVTCFPELPDVHVLAALYDPENRDRSFALAARAGIPVLADGLESMLDWFATSAMRMAAPPPLVRRGVASGPWTSFVEPKSTPTIALVQPSGRATLVDIAVPALGSKLTDAVGMVALPNGNVGSAFVVTPTLILTTAHIAEAFEFGSARVYFQSENERWPFVSPEPPVESWRVVRVVATFDPPRGELKGILSQDQWAESRPVLVELDRPVAVTPLAIARSTPATGRSIVVVGFPGFKNALVPKAYGDVFADPCGRRHYMPGTLDPSKGIDGLLEYLCFTSQGVSGGPVFDATTGFVVGMHVAGSLTGDRKRGVAMPLGGLADALAEHGVRIEL
ncbi:trypsin-like peptidase domain-containing protein [Nannocystis pusilla]|uniref:trypsin-like peptidase domain-containing protein n=1 Tax=Nannocystis pusilla TaxID=889268 RepID=UPI003BEF8761